MKLWALALFLFVSTSVLQAQQIYKNVNGETVYRPTKDLMPGVVNLPCQDGWYSHSLHDEGACSNHGGFARGVNSSGAGGTCDKKCRETVMIVGAAVAVTAVTVILIKRHKEHNEETKEFCLANPDASVKKKSCADWLKKHDKDNK